MLYHGGSETNVDKELARQYHQLLTKLGIEHSYVEVVVERHCELDLRPVLKFMSDDLNHETP